MEEQRKYISEAYENTLATDVNQIYQNFKVEYQGKSTMVVQQFMEQFQLPVLVNPATLARIFETEELNFAKEILTAIHHDNLKNGYTMLTVEDPKYLPILQKERLAGTDNTLKNPDQNYLIDFSSKITEQIKEHIFKMNKEETLSSTYHQIIYSVHRFLEMRVPILIENIHSFCLFPMQESLRCGYEKILLTYFSNEVRNELLNVFPESSKSMSEASKKDLPSNILL